MKKIPRVSIVIPLYVITDYFYEAVDKCLQLDYPNFEILIGKDRNTKIELSGYSKSELKKIRVLKTGLKRTGPAEKRDIAIRKSTGEIIAFLDDDSYPQKNWLKQAIKILKQKKVASVCGPGLTPPKDSFWQKMTGAVLSSIFGSGPYKYRFVKDRPRYVDDYPAYNMFVTRDILRKIGGFGTEFYGGEDTAVCLKIIEAGEKIYYHPDIVVYHHRRHFPFEYGKQVGNVGKHRGYFVKKYPQTSLRPSYFAPAVFIVGIFIVLLLSMINRTIFFTTFYLLLLFYLLVFYEVNNDTDRLHPIRRLLLPFAIIYNHYAYGINFLKGLLFINDLKR